MSDFFISGFSESVSAPLSLPSAFDMRRAELTQFAYVELARFEFGVLDTGHGKQTLAAQDLAAAQRRVGMLSHPRARQRTHAYMPIGGHEHCPHCWVFEGAKRTLAFADAGGVETADCGECGSQYQILVSPPQLPR